VDEGYKPLLRLVVEVLAARCFNDAKIFASDVFCYFVGYDEGNLVS